MNQINLHTRSTVNRAATHHLIFRENDPCNYGFICPACQLRWGDLKSARSFIDVERCSKCPPLSAGILENKASAEAKRRRRLKNKVSDGLAEIEHFR